MTRSGDGKPNGLILGRYHILAKLGQGGMGDVFLAAAEGFAGFSKLVVIKRLRNMDDPQHIAMFLNEARIARQLNHLNIVQTYEIGHEEGSHLLVMEYLHGPTLAHLRKAVRTGPLPWAVEVEILRQVLEGLHYAHELCAIDGRPLHLVHRDLSPENVIVTDLGECKILDFGIAKAVDSIVQTQAGFFKGKLKNMPPEQFRGEKVDRRADIFAAGVMLWEGLSGKPLWGDRGSAAIAVQLAQGEIPELRELAPEVPEELRQLCEQALRPEPGERFANALAMRAALSSYVGLHGAGLDRAQLGAFVEPLFRAERERIDHIIRSQRDRNVRFSTALNAAPVSSIASGGNSELTMLETQPLGSTERRQRGWGLRAALSVLGVIGVMVVAAAGWFGLADRAADRPSSLSPSPARKGAAPAFGSSFVASKGSTVIEGSSAARDGFAPASRTSTRSQVPPHKQEQAAAREPGGRRKVKGDGWRRPPRRGGPRRRRSASNKRLAVAAETDPRSISHPIGPDRSLPKPPEPLSKPSPRGEPSAQTPGSKPRPAPKTGASSSPSVEAPFADSIGTGNVPIPPPQLPRVFLADSFEGLVRICDDVEAKVVSQAGVAPAFAKGITRPLRQLVGANAKLYPVGMYWFIVREAGLGHDRRAAAEALAEAHSRRIIERLSGRLPAVEP